MKRIQPSGLTNKISIENNNLVKRSWPYADYYLNREDEKKFYETFHSQKFLKIPKTIKKIGSTWISEMQFYNKASTLSNKKINLNELKNIKQLIDQLHNLSINLKIFDPKAFLNLFINQTEIIDELKPLTNRIKKIIVSYYDDEKKPVVSHNDLIRDNFLIIDGQTYLIDFEYVSLNHPLFDYASFYSESLDNENEKKAFLKILNLDDQESKKLDDLILYQNYLWAHWAKYMYRETKQKIYLDIMNQKINQALNQSSVR